MRARSLPCGICQGPKVHPSPTAYVYCDWCGALMDWDLQLDAGKDQRTLGPEFQKLFTEFAPRIARLQREQDHAGMHAVYKEIYLRHMELCPGAYSPRAVDPEYREKLADYSAASIVLGETDEALRPLNRLMAHAQQQLQSGWAQAGLGNPIPEGVFAPFFQAWQAHQKAFEKRAVDSGLLARHPDRLAPQVFARMATAALLQGWRPHLPQALAQRLIGECGLEAQYVEGPDFPEVERACASCGTKAMVLVGSKQYLCDACGKLCAAADPTTERTEH